MFNFHGGTLVASQVNATQLSGTAAPSVQGTFYNTGGTLAPGGIGTPGKTAITGNYVQSGGALAIDIGGTTKGNGFQTGQYDYLSSQRLGNRRRGLERGIDQRLRAGCGDDVHRSQRQLGTIAGSFSNVANGGFVTPPGNSDLVRPSFTAAARLSPATQVTLTTIVGSNASLLDQCRGRHVGHSSNWNTAVRPAAPDPSPSLGLP